MAFVLKKLQERLDSVFQTVDTVKRTREDCPLSITMASDVNNGLLQSKKINEQGQKVDLELVWNLPDCTGADNGCVTDPCATADSAPTQDKMTVSIACNTDNTFHKAYTFSYADFMDATALMDTLPDLSAPLSETIVNGTSVEDKLLSLISTVDKACESALATNMVAAVPATTFGFSQKEVPSLTNLATDKGKAVKTYGSVGVTFNELFTEVRKSAKIARYNNDPILLGGYPLEQYGLLSSAFCCSSDGVNLKDIINVNKTPFIVSDALIDAFNTEYTLTDFTGMPYFLSYDRGSMQLINYFTFAGGFGVNNGLTLRKQILSPFTDRPMGLTITMSSCGTEVTVRVQSTEILVNRPETQCEGDFAYGVNGLQQFVIKNS